MAFVYNPVTNSFSGETQKTGNLGQVMWHITDECKLNCALCFTKKMRTCMRAVSEASVPEYVALLKALGVQKIDISGGEPLLYPHLKCLCTTCLENGIAVTITTSGLGLEENVAWVSEHWSLFSRVILSLDGSEPLHNRLRGSQSAYMGAYTFYKRLEAAKCENLRINTVVTRPLCDPQEQKILCDFIAELSVKEWCLIQPYPINKTECFDCLAPDMAAFSLFVSRCRSHKALSHLCITQRTNTDYNAYWALYPDGYLYYSNNRTEYDVKIELTRHLLREIKGNVMQHPQIYISAERKEEIS